MKKVIVFLGTRPEAIKLAPVIEALKESGKFNTLVCSTGQHKEMLQQVLDRARQAVCTFIASGLETAMNQFNGSAKE